MSPEMRTLLDCLNQNGVSAELVSPDELLNKLAHEAEVHSLVAVRAKRVTERMNRIKAMAREIEELRTGEVKPLSREELIERFKLEAQNVAPTNKTIFKEIRRGYIVAMTPEQAAFFDSGKTDNVVSIFDKKDGEKKEKKEKAPVEVAVFDEIVKKNKKNEERVAKERNNANKSVLRSYRIKN